jgi:hypothetical protein
MLDSSPRSAKITRFVGEDDFDLCLRIGELIELSEVRDCGPAAILNRLASGLWYIQDITDTIRLALIGGGMAPREAKALVARAIKEAYLQDYLTVALECLYAAMAGVPDDMPEEDDDEPEEPLTPEV